MIKLPKTKSEIKLILIYSGIFNQTSKKNNIIYSRLEKKKKLCGSFKFRKKLNDYIASHSLIPNFEYYVNFLDYFCLK